MKFSPETTYFRVPMETVHVILVVSGPSVRGKPRVGRSEISDRAYGLIWYDIFCLWVQPESCHALHKTEIVE